jgi:ribosomal protein S6--L-glutamate ligase
MRVDDVRGDQMKIGILSQRPEQFSTKRLVAAGEGRGHDMRVIQYMQCYMSIATHRPVVMYEGTRLEDLDAIIPRVGTANTFYGCAVIRQLELGGVYSVNGSQAVARARDKLRSLQILSRKGIPMPVTGFASSTRDTHGLIEMVGGAPLIIKLLEGTQGIGVVLAETQQAAESVIDAFRGLNANILVQEFISESRGADLRCFVVGQKVVAAMLRTAPEGEFRANIHRGGPGSKVKLTPEERSIALSAAKALGLRVAGVDMIRSQHGALVLEVNSSPGLEGIERATGKDVAGAIIDHIEKSAVAGTTTDRVGH